MAEKIYIPVVLASASPRRQELLRFIYPSFRVESADIDESPISGESAEELVVRLAQAKAALIAKRHPESLIIAADTVVVSNNQILGKPSSAEDAQRMLTMLSGQVHYVWTAYSIQSIKLEIQLTRAGQTSVEFFSISDQEIQDYLESGEPFDKAGSYALQGIAGKFIKGIVGSQTNVIGLDIAALNYDLKRLGLV